MGVRYSTVSQWMQFKSNHQTTIIEQPNELISKILIYLTKEDVARLELTCRRLYQVCRQVYRLNEWELDRFSQQLFEGWKQNRVSLMRRFGKQLRKLKLGFTYIDFDLAETLLVNCSNVQSLTIDTYKLKIQFLVDLAKVTGLNMRTVSIEGTEELKRLLTDQDFVALIQHWTRLESLRISTVDGPGRYRVIPLSVTMSVLPLSLTSLDIADCKDVDAHQLKLALNRISNVCSLKLSYGDYYDCVNVLQSTVTTIRNLHIQFISTTHPVINCWQNLRNMEQLQCLSISNVKIEHELIAALTESDHLPFTLTKLAIIRAHFDYGSTDLIQVLAQSLCRLKALVELDVQQSFHKSLAIAILSNMHTYSIKFKYLNLQADYLYEDDMPLISSESLEVLELHIKNRIDYYADYRHLDIISGPKLMSELAATCPKLNKINIYNDDRYA